MEFLGNIYMAPKDYTGYLEHQYGKNWNTPVQFFNYKKSRLGLLKQFIMQYIKSILPFAITERIQSRKDRPNLEKYLKRIDDKRNNRQ